MSPGRWLSMPRLLLSCSRKAAATVTTVAPDEAPGTCRRGFKRVKDSDGQLPVKVALKKTHAHTIIQGTTNFNNSEAWRRMVNRYAPANPPTSLVAAMRVTSPQRPKRLNQLGSATETWELQLNALAKDHDGPRSCSCSRTISKTSCSRVRTLPARTRRCVTRSRAWSATAWL